MYLFKADSDDVALAVTRHLDDISKFDHLDMRYLNLLELSELTHASSQWAVDEVSFDETEGFLLLRYSYDSLIWIKNNLEEIEPYGVSRQSAIIFCSSLSGNCLLYTSDAADE